MFSRPLFVFSFFLVVVAVLSRNPTVRVKRNRSIKQILTKEVAYDQIANRFSIHVVLITGQIVNCDDLDKQDHETADMYVRRCLKKRSVKDLSNLQLGAIYLEKYNSDTKTYSVEREIHEIDKLTQQLDFKTQRISTTQIITADVHCTYLLNGVRNHDTKEVKLNFWSGLNNLRRACEKRAAEVGMKGVKMLPYAQLLTKKGELLEVINSEGRMNGGPPVPTEDDEESLPPTPVALLYANPGSYFAFSQEVSSQE